MEGTICIGTNLHDEQTLLIAVKCVLHPFSGPNNLFLETKCRKISLDKHPFCILFQVPPPCAVFDSLCLIAMHCVGTLVVINNDEKDHLRCNPMLSTLFNTLLAPPVCTL